MIALVNAKRIALGRSTLGFVNPALYKYASAGSSPIYCNDITDGDNACTSYGLVCCDEGFYATTGYDPVTGLGSLDYEKFSTMFTSF